MDWVNYSHQAIHGARNCMFERPVTQCDREILQLSLLRQSRIKWDVHGQLHEALVIVYKAYGQVRMTCEGPDSEGVWWIKCYEVLGNGTGCTWKLVHVLRVDSDKMLERHVQKQVQPQPRRENDSRYSAGTSAPANTPSISLAASLISTATTATSDLSNNTALNTLLDKQAIDLLLLDVKQLEAHSHRHCYKPLKPVDQLQFHKLKPEEWIVVDLVGGLTRMKTGL